MISNLLSFVCVKVIKVKETRRDFKSRRKESLHAPITLTRFFFSFLWSQFSASCKSKLLLQCSHIRRTVLVTMKNVSWMHCAISRLSWHYLCCTVSTLLFFFLSFSTLPPVNIFPLATVSSLPFDAFLCRIEYGREGHNNTNSHRSGLLMIILLNAVQQKQQHCSIRKKKKKKKKKNDHRMKSRKTAGRRSTSGGGNRNKQINRSLLLLATTRQDCTVLILVQQNRQTVVSCR